GGGGRRHAVDAAHDEPGARVVQLLRAPRAARRRRRRGALIPYNPGERGASAPCWGASEQGADAPRSPTPRIVRGRGIWYGAGETVRHALEGLQARRRFDLVEFAECPALGFRAVQARRTGVGLGDVRLLVRLHGRSQWGREGNRVWPTGAEDLRGDYAERYA